MYAENDLLLAECVRHGAWAGLDAPGLAAAVSMVTYQGREEAVGAALPGGPRGPLGRAASATEQAWERLTEVEARHGVVAAAAPDLGLAQAIHRWAKGGELDGVLRERDLSAGDFVRWTRQVVDVLGQLAAAAPAPQVRATARRAADSVWRGIVAYSAM
jgi:ATP-dependent RNA helicase HelY